MLSKQLNKPLLRKWVAALRSGKYHQTDQYLCNIKNGQAFHCCLGVACRVAIKNGTVIKTENGDYAGIRYILFDGDETDLTQDILDLFGISDEFSRKLIAMNDGGDTFKEIADYIEKTCAL